MNSIIYELRANNVKEEDIQAIINEVKDKLSEENLDKALVLLGYPKIFTIDYDDFYDEDIEDIEDIKEDEYQNFEK